MNLAGYLLPAAPAEPYAHLDTGGSAAKGLRDARVEAGFPAELPAT